VAAFPSGWRRTLPMIAAAYAVGAFVLIVPRVIEPGGPDLKALVDGELTDAQTYTLDMVKEFNTYLMSITALAFGGLGWYLSQYRPAKSAVLRAVFFATVGFLALAIWYAALAYSQTASELAQDAIGLRPGMSRILYYLQLEFLACAIAGVLILIVFADAVTRAPVKT